MACAALRARSMIFSSAESVMFTMYRLVNTAYARTGYVSRWAGGTKGQARSAFSPGLAGGWLSRVARIATPASNALLVFQGLLTHQGEEGLEAGSVADAGVELDSGGRKQSASIEASSCLPLAFCSLSLAFSCLSRSVSFTICSLSLLTCKISLSSCFILSSCCILRCSKCSICRS
jgi:hypothetical protein